LTAAGANFWTPAPAANPRSTPEKCLISSPKPNPFASPTGLSVAPIPADLQDRRVEITGPVDRKMVINALNSGASAFMADFEDSNSPTWSNNIQGQINLRDAVRGTISFSSPEGKKYALAAKTAVLLVRPRGPWCNAPDRSQLHHAGTRSRVL
jgi:hypothetical protein